MLNELFARFDRLAEVCTIPSPLERTTNTMNYLMNFIAEISPITD